MSGESGIALILALVLIVACAILAAGFLVLVHQETAMNSDQGGGMQALWLAEAAGHKGYNVIRANKGNFSDTIKSGPLAFSYQGIHGTIQYSLCPGRANRPTTIKVFTILPSGTRGNDNRNLEIKVREESFTEFASVTGMEHLAPPEDWISFYWNTGDSAIGRVHSNDRFNFNGAPIFVQPVTSSSHYSYNSWGGSPVFRKPPYKYHLDPVTFPTSDSALQQAVWGQAGGYPSSKGVYLAKAQGRSGGIYVFGDCQLVFSTSNHDWDAYLTFTQDTTVTVVDIDYRDSLTSVTVNGRGTGSYPNYIPNGAIFVNGNVTSLSGVVNGLFTVGTDMNAGQDITITNHLYYSVDPRSTPTTRDMLGLVARNVSVTGNVANLKVQAFILAGGQYTSGSFRNVKVVWDSMGHWGSSQGTLTLYGGVAQCYVGVLGRSNCGYTRAFTYDTRGVYLCPPYFPPTGRFIVTSWRELSAGV